MLKIISRVFLLVFVLSAIFFSYSCNKGTENLPSGMPDINDNEPSSILENPEEVVDKNEIVTEDEVIENTEKPSDYVEISMVPIEYNGYKIMAIGNTDPSFDEETVYLFQTTALDFLFALTDEDLDKLKDICTEELYSKIASKDKSIEFYYEHLAGVEITAFESITSPIISKNIDSQQTISLVILFNTETSSRLVHFGVGFNNDLEMPTIEEYGIF